MATKSLNTDQQISIQALIRSWDGKLTWELLVTRIESSLGLITTRQTLDKYKNIKDEYKAKKLMLKGQPISPADNQLLTYLKGDIDLAQKVMDLEAEMKVAKDELGYMKAFIQKITDIGQNDPNVMAVFQKAMRDIEKRS